MLPRGRERLRRRTTTCSRDVLRAWIATGQIGEGSFLWEDNGFLAASAEACGALSSLGWAGALYWNVNARMEFFWAVRGEVIARFDPLLSDPDERRLNRLVDPSVARALEVSWDQSPLASAADLLCRLAGGLPPLDRTWLDRPGVEFWSWRAHAERPRT